ncbi:MAG TPA: MATE family efflux transporter [Vicinamibacterales bacterium]|nr:MATE family efflux transporter [Vicinamibacterales bacterium]
MLSLSAPVIVAELGWVTMGIVDMVMVGRLGPDAIGAVGIASSLFIAVGVFAMGLLLGLDPLVAQAFGARRIDDCHRWLVAGVWLAALATPPTIGVVYLMNRALPHLGLPPPVVALAQPYLSVVGWSLPPLLLYVAFRRYLQAMNIVRAVTYTLVIANVTNALANWVLIFGHYGAPQLGVTGAAWATLASRIVMAAALFVVILRHERRMQPRLRETPLALDMPRVRRLVRLGLPAGGQMLLEVGVFASATALAGRVSTTALAAHQIAIQMASLTFMIPFGLSSAAAVRVGQAIGRRDPAGAIAAGWTAIALGVSFMAAAALVFLTVPGLLIRMFSADAEVIALGVRLLFVAAVFQLFDALQGVTTGALRGLADTRTAMLWNLGGHWGVGLPLGYVLCFHAGYGVVGLWWGLSLGLVICGISLVTVWRMKGIHLAR